MKHSYVVHTKCRGDIYLKSKNNPNTLQTHSQINLREIKTCTQVYIYGQDLLKVFTN